MPRAPYSGPVNARTSGAAETQALAAALAAECQAADLLVLSGDLGAGKTAFTQGLGRGLGVTERITSPTFTIAAVYEGRELTLNHLDVYRLGSLAEAIDLGINELVDADAVTVIEWGDTIEPVLPHDFLRVAITFGREDDDRLLAIDAHGPAWADRLDRVHKAISAWVVDR